MSYERRLAHLGGSRGGFYPETRANFADVPQPAEVISLEERRESSQHYNARILFPLLRYIDDHLTPGEAESILQRAKVTRADILSRRSAWMSFDQFDRFLQGVVEQVPDEQEFMRAASYKLHEAYGPLRFVLWATAPHRVVEISAKYMHLVSNVSRWELLEVSPTLIRARYYSKMPETRWMELSRQAQTIAMPTLWGLPKAQLQVKCSLGEGAPHSEWVVRFFRRPGWMPVLLGGMAGLLLAGLSSLLPSGSLLPWLSLPMAGAALGYGWESRRTYRRNLDFSQEVTDAVRELARAEREARQENLGLLDRQKDWSRLMEEQVRDRTALLQQLVEDLRSLQADQQSAVQGVSHDLRNPLSVIRFGTELLRKEMTEGPLAVRDLVEDMSQATDRMDSLLSGLIRSASSDPQLIEVNPEPVEVQPLVERLRRRLRALVHGRDIRVSVFRTREAPDAIECDQLILDRVLDNLLTNAAKYTETGSIVVEVGGTPGFLTVKVSDTGRGIDEDKIQSIFRPAATPPADRAPQSFGVGLSVVVQLLDQIGGRIEVMSRAGRGTTFWAHFPEELTPRSSGGRPALERVVTIRRLPTPR
jgi:signal transduction histidine kinase